ncbi:hypothetical protein DFH94DRAFT_841378 [Russula ochroleuca]|uniref:Uncharacterized protein n=1 Tax=Russula ochroleuca TaxID=152965 RepID=A0A9P5MJT8_9AGAM|nr:hypothetical protein DFH94DRAFT_849308 [Russula ochroleuca]KAF8486921.1 hypothetical protein DFH94DRAFT_841378 [Russula ochroleuca]
MQPPLEPPSASMGVEVSGAVSGSEKMALTEKRDVKESIDVLRGSWCFCLRAQGQEHRDVSRFRMEEVPLSGATKPGRGEQYARRTLGAYRKTKESYICDSLEENRILVRGNDRPTVLGLAVEMQTRDANSSHKVGVMGSAPPVTWPSTASTVNKTVRKILTRLDPPPHSPLLLVAFLRTIRNEHPAYELAANKPSQNCQRRINLPKTIS